MRVPGVGTAGALALQLIAKSLWFRCTPLPQDEFEFAVKVEHAHILNSLAAVTAPPIVSSYTARPPRLQHPQDVLSPQDRADADANAIEMFRPQAQPGQRLWLETTFCGTWCGNYRLEQPSDDFESSSRYQLVPTYEVLPASLSR